MTTNDAQGEQEQPKYAIVDDEGGILDRSALVQILDKLPISFCFAKEEADPRDIHASYKTGKMQVYHNASVISFYPENGVRLYNAIVTDWDFPLRPDNIMDDQLGLRCCFHPRLTSFGVDVPERNVVGDQIEIDIHKFPKQSADRRYEKLD